MTRGTGFVAYATVLGIGCKNDALQTALCHALWALKCAYSVVANLAVVAFIIAGSAMPRVFLEVTARATAICESVLAGEFTNLVVANFARLALQITGTAMSGMHREIDARTTTICQNLWATQVAASLMAYHS